VNSGLIFDIRRFSVHDGPGIRTTVFFKGCPLACWWCHNPESQDFKSEQSIKKLVLSGKKFERKETTGTFMTAEKVFQEIERDRIFYEESDGGVTFSGGEPLMQEAFLFELLKLCKSEGIHTSLDTSGYATNTAIKHISKLVDLFLYDIKLMDDTLHRKYTGVSNKSILENLRFLFQTGNNIILRFPVVPGITDTSENIRLLVEYIKMLQDEIPHGQFVRPDKKSALEIDLLPYHIIAKGKYHRFNKSNKLQHLSPMKIEELEPIKQKFEAIGMLVKLGG